MSEQDPREQLVREALDITVGVPYEAIITSKGVELQGQVMFSLDDGLSFTLTTPLLPSDTIGRQTYTHGSSTLWVTASNRCFMVQVLSDRDPPHHREIDPNAQVRTIAGRLKDFWIGEGDTLTWITVGYSGILWDWCGGNANDLYKEYHNYDNGWRHTEQIPGMVLEYSDWSVRLFGQPDHHVKVDARSIARIDRKTPFSSCEARQFLEDLHKFLSFLFGGNPGMVYAIGYHDYKADWGCLGSVSQPAKYRSMFRDPKPYSSNLSDIFKEFCTMGEEDKAILSSMITHYTTSEELVWRINPAVILPAIVVSYSALEGLVRWIGYSHDDIHKRFFRKPKGKRDKQERRLKDRVGLSDVIVPVLERENIIDEGDRCAMKGIVKRMQEVRDSIAHVTDMYKWEGIQLHSTWDMSQWLVEALILRKLGFDGDVSEKLRGLLQEAHIPPHEESASDG